MRVLIVAVGSRGDVAPCAGLGTALRAAGHSVVLAGYEQYTSLVTGAGLEFQALPGDPRLLEAASWQRGGTGPLGAARLVRLIADHLRELHQGVLTAARQGAEVLLLQGIATIGGYHIAQGLGLPSMGLGLQPVYPTGDFAPSIVTARSLGRWGNRAAGWALIALGAPALAGPVRELRAELGLPRLGTRAAIFGEQDRARWPAYHGYSPAVLPRPADWRPGLEVAGYWWPPRPEGWRPPEDLDRFIGQGPPPVFVGFGSMTPASAQRAGEMAAEAGRRAGVRLVIQAGAAGLEGSASDDTMVIGDVPHDWLFPRMAAVVHHAGAGTTGAALRAGTPAVPVPVMADQPFWAARLHRLGVSPRPLPYEELTAEALGAAITTCVTEPAHRRRAAELARHITAEDGAAAVLAHIRTRHDG
jgi:sterol 3beta-glucosyltransferase